MGEIILYVGSMMRGESLGGFNGMYYLEKWVGGRGRGLRR